MRLYVASGDNYGNHHLKDIKWAVVSPITRLFPCLTWMISAKVERLYAYKKDSYDDITYVHANYKIKEAINIKLSIQIKFGLHHYLL